MQNVTMQDIADRLGVSKVTVSKALNNKDGVSKELKVTIVELAKEMGYRMNTIAKSLKVNATFNIGVIVPEQFTNTGKYHRQNESASFYMEFYQSVTKALEEEHYSAILQILTGEEEDNNILPRLYQNKKIDGFIILGQVSRSYIEKLQSTKLPVVFLDFYDEYMNIDSVITDNFTASYMITNYLINNGFEDLVFVGNIYSTSSIQDRFLGFYRSLLENKIVLNNEGVISDRDDKGVFIDIKYPKEMPQAFVCNCDQVASIVIRDLQQKGYKIPEDISVVGFDNSIYSSVSVPQITTVELDIHKMAQEGVRLILRKIEEPEYHVGKVAVKGKCIYKESVKTITK